eukprot:607669-Ditylum_brightwellii.AAC.1
MPTMAVTHDKSLAIKQQTAIGWRQFFDSHIIKMWSDLQDKYLQDIKLHTQYLNGASWANKLLNSYCNNSSSCGLNIMR